MNPVENSCRFSGRFSWQKKSIDPPPEASALRCGTHRWKPRRWALGEAKLGNSPRKIKVLICFCWEYRWQINGYEW